ncbi:MAG: cbb3-type cytochrome c oxidase N-terminal domain-containing protein [Planctomycetota bacterium]|jgi:cytochrome c oxidase cbb3-type subunit 3
MSNGAKDILRDHTYDDIQEYDNPTPGWWTWTFVGTILFSVVYWAFFHMSPASWTLHEAYEKAVAANLEKQFGDLGEMALDDATIMKYSRDAKWLAFGASVYNTHCVSCHKKDGSGLVGPNLTDDLYKNVQTPADIATVIAEGAGSGAMPPWKTRLRQSEIMLVSSYVASLRGQDLPSIRPLTPDEKEIPAWPQAPTQPTQ